MKTAHTGPLSENRDEEYARDLPQYGDEGGEVRIEVELGEERGEEDSGTVIACSEAYVDHRETQRSPNVGTGEDG